MYVKFGQLLRSHTASIVERVLSLSSSSVVPLVTTSAPRNVRPLRDALLEDTNRHFDFLHAALEVSRPSLFSEYTAWHLQVAHSHALPVEDIRLTYQEILSTLRGMEHPEAPRAVSIVDEALSRIRDFVPTATVSSEPEESATARLSTLYLELLLAAKRQDALSLVMNAVDEGLPLEDLYLQVLQPAMRKVGSLWLRNEITVAQEHYVSAATQLIVSQLYPRLLEGVRNGKVLVAGCVASNLHEIGLRFLCDIFELRGWDTHFYGANTPTTDFVDSIRKRRPDVVALGATLSSQLPAIVEVIRDIRKAPDTTKTPILVGGAAFWGHEELWREMGADGFASDATTAVQLAEQLAGAA